MNSKSKTKSIKHLSNPKPVRKASVVVILLLIGIWLMPAPKPALADGINTVVVTHVKEAPGDETLVTVTFTPITSLVSGSISINLGNNTTDGNPFTDGGTTLSAADMNCTQSGGGTITGTVYAAATATVPMMFTGTVNASGNTNQVVCILGDNEDTDAPHLPAVAGSYSVAVVTNSDSGAGMAYVGNANDVAVSATVLPNLSMLLDAAASNCSGGPVIVCNLGVLSTATVSSGAYDVNIGTNAVDGASLKVTENNDMTNLAADTIADIAAEGTIAAGTEAYGIAVADGNGALAAVHPFHSGDNAIPTSPTEVAASIVPLDIAGDDITVTHKIAISTTTKPGVYSHIVTWTASATF